MRRLPCSVGLWCSRSWRILAGFLGFVGLAGLAATIAKMLFVVFLVLLVVGFVIRALRGQSVV